MCFANRIDCHSRFRELLESFLGLNVRACSSIKAGRLFDSGKYRRGLGETCFRCGIQTLSAGSHRVLRRVQALDGNEPRRRFLERTGVRRVGKRIRRRRSDAQEPLEKLEKLSSVRFFAFLYVVTSLLQFLGDSLATRTHTR